MISAEALVERRADAEKRADVQTLDPAFRQYTFLAPGFAKWWGSDARALAQAFRRLGHTVLDIDEEDYVPWRWQTATSKVLRRLFSRVWIEEYNRAVLRQADSAAYDFVLVFKGNLLKPETIQTLRQTGKTVFNFYPDLSFADHGPNIPATLHLYDCVFTTKSYHGGREIERYGISRLEHVQHGFDREVHRPVTVSAEMLACYGCDVSFVGCWSPRKERQILYLLRHSERVSVRVFGLGWKYSSNEFKDRMGSNLKPGVFGDELAIAYCASKISLGLLSCGVSDPTTCDQTTARTFQIPATKSLMLHEDTPEVRSFFKENDELLLFSSDDDLVAKVNAALSDDAMRAAVSGRGYERCLQEPYDYSNAAKSILQNFEQMSADKK
ncbi:MAG TPA: glycosyltransferase [Pyrinomonadaceae bacterium]|nr:glycosyltransferase [Pyrinomonadaceae bacterium]